MCVFKHIQTIFLPYVCVQTHSNNIPCICVVCIQTHSNHIPCICMCSNTIKQHSMHMCVSKTHSNTCNIPCVCVYSKHIQIHATFHAYVCIQNTFKYMQHSMRMCVFKTHSNTFKHDGQKCWAMWTACMYYGGYWV
jgi:hypothetical protein